MKAVDFRYSIQSALQAHRRGLVLTCDTHLRHALSAANAMKRRDLIAGVMRCRNKLRPSLISRRASIVSASN